MLSTTKEFLALNLSDDLREIVLDLNEKDWGILRTVKPYVAQQELFIGHDDYYPIVYEKNGIFLHDPLLKRYINKDIKKFLQCLSAYEMYGKEVQNVIGEDEQLCVVNHYIDIFNQIDATCRINENNFWSIISDQMEEGNL